ncbi:hypothetical protein PSECIP111951_03955 [Pseudoalteromonas holothuriae]|uniref:AttH domain-containing protein n=1 Tax=Pseudoalteromonas holothuriae TaxID=2963714 RepID=A0ABM9GN62_9GAMM|nr:lipocalin-like domain-containing protein [Pseudoalteromonas sp. CIP111951]CAH9067967.1 hypothetical protein PSECIP111951_03955 [Pseudoalteromonas sp. CIP111951]
MVSKLWLILPCVLLWACQPNQPNQPNQHAWHSAQGAVVKKGLPLVFPKDHGPHVEQGIEWWYVTANLQSESGESFGVQWTLFRALLPSKINSPWWDNNLYFAHFAVQHKQQHKAYERFARAQQAQISSVPFSAKIDDWHLSSVGEDFLPLRLQAVYEGEGVDLSLSNSPITLHGEQGYSQKTQSGHASYYFSYPFLDVNGSVTFAGKTYKVTGNAWYDREWSASLIDKQQLGWDWFSLVSDTTNKQGLMLFCIRGKAQNYEYCSGTHIAKDGQTSAIPKAHISLSVLEHIKLDGSQYPSKWQVTLKGHKPIVIETVTKDARNKLIFPYWEGRVTATGGFEGKGYAELTGY